MTVTPFGTNLSKGNSNPYGQDSIVLTTYDFANQKVDYLSQIEWNITVFEEAHHLCGRIAQKFSGRKTTRYKDCDSEGDCDLTFRQAIGNSFKLLLTATPMQNDIMDFYSLIYFKGKS